MGSHSVKALKFMENFRELVSAICSQLLKLYDQYEENTHSDSPVHEEAT